MRKTIIGIIIGIVVGATTCVVASNLMASNVSYQPKDSSWAVSNVEAAIDSLKLSKTSDNYSTEEKVVGTWIDGKPLYQKTIDVTLPSSAGSSQYNFSVTTANIIDIRTHHIYDNTNGNIIFTTFPWFEYSSGAILGAITKIDKNKYYIYVNSNRSDVNLVMTVYYTKTTDQANS